MSSKLLVGFGAGLLLGVLFAPDKGSVTRQKIADKGSDLKDRFNDLVDNLSGKAEDVAAEVDEFAAKAKTKLKTQM
jgi:gas vesicle protein